jgi:hypothetical protein
MLSKTWQVWQQLPQQWSQLRNSSPNLAAAVSVMDLKFELDVAATGPEDVAVGTVCNNRGSSSRFQQYL